MKTVELGSLPTSGVSGAMAVGHTPRITLGSLGAAVIVGGHKSRTRLSACSPDFAQASFSFPSGPSLKT